MPGTGDPGSCGKHRNQAHRVNDALCVETMLQAVRGTLSGGLMKRLLVLDFAKP